MYQCLLNFLQLLVLGSHVLCTCSSWFSYIVFSFYRKATSANRGDSAKPKKSRRPINLEDSGTVILIIVQFVSKKYRVAHCTLVLNSHTLNAICLPHKATVTALY